MTAIKDLRFLINQSKDKNQRWVYVMLFKSPLIYNGLLLKVGTTSNNIKRITENVHYESMGSGGVPKKKRLIYWGFWMEKDIEISIADSFKVFNPSERKGLYCEKLIKKECLSMGFTKPRFAKDWFVVPSVSNIDDLVSMFEELFKKKINGKYTSHISEKAKIYF